MYFVISILGVLIFVGLTAYDTQKIKNMYVASDSGELMGKSIPLSDIGWEILNKRKMLFFLGLAVLNEFVWRTQTEEFWVNFKVWGMLPITIIFTAFQIPLIYKHKTDAQ